MDGNGEGTLCYSWIITTNGAKKCQAWPEGSIREKVVLLLNRVYPFIPRYHMLKYTWK